MAYVVGLRTGTNPQMTDQPSQRPRLPLWEPGEVEWLALIPTSHRRREARQMLLILVAAYSLATQASALGLACLGMCGLGVGVAYVRPHTQSAVR